MNNSNSIVSLFTPKTLLLWVLSFMVLGCKSPQKLPDNTQPDYGLTNEFLEAKKALYSGQTEKAVKLYSQCIQHNSAHHPSYFELARLYEFQNSTKAIALAQKAVELDPENNWYAELLLRLYQSSKDYEKAIEVNKQLIKQYPQNKDYYYNLANLYIESKDYEGALKAYDLFLQKFGYEQGVLEQQKQIYLKKGQYKKAVEVLEVLSQRNPQNKDYLGMIAEIYSKTGNSEQAMVYYQKILTIDPKDGYVHFAMADFYLQRQLMKAAKTEILLGMQAPDLAVNAKMKVLMQTYQWSLEDSLKKPFFDSLYHIANELHPNNAAILALGADVALGRNDIKGAAQLFEQVLAVDSSKYIIWEQLMEIDYQSQQFTKLKAHSQRALALFPQYPQVYYYQALSLEPEGDWKRIKQLMKVGNNFVYEAKQKANFYAMEGKAEIQMGEVDDGKANFDRALKLDVQNNQIKSQYAYSLATHNLELSKALNLAKEAYELEPQNQVFLHHYIYCLHASGAKDEAKLWIQRATQKYPNDLELKLLQTEIFKNE
jgi:tetratricopeptide (TPR) repeat protein